MELWTEYEGKTIDGAFPLTRLLRPEGDSAFFTTSDGDGPPRVVRLIEASSDADDILSRWRGVAALDHPNILKLEDYGQVVINRTSLVYAVMEPVDANLGDVVGAQRLSLEDTRQLAESLLSVLEALHSHGFVHGHVDPTHVLAVGETVKLQCDSICDAPEGQVGQDLKQRDVHDLAALLALALTQEPVLDAGAKLLMPEPFDAIVSKGISGDWGVAEIAAALEIAREPLHEVLPLAVSAAPAAAVASPSPQMPLFAEDAASGLPPEKLSAAEEGLRKETEDKAILRLVWWLVASLAAVVLIVMAVTWPLLRSGKQGANAKSVTISGHSPATAQHSPAAQPAAPSANLQPTPVAAPAAQWRVVAFSFRRERQAQKKADQIARRHPSLHSEVYRPGGAGRYLISLGGAMDRDQAQKLANDLRHQGYPRDTHAQQRSATEQ